MGNIKFKEQIKEVENLIKTNSKDARYADKLIKQLKSLQGQLSHEPTLVHIPIDNIEQEAKGDTFTMSLTKSGECVYKTKGGYTVIVDSKYGGFFDTIATIVSYMNNEQDLNEEMKKLMESDVIATTLLLNLPLTAMGDVEYKYKVVNDFIEYLESKMSNAEEELKEETIEDLMANKDFKETAIAIEELKNELEKHTNS